ncbi:MAG: molecular chaperone DnaJ [Anaerolineaceae bacterium]|nr:molecular chaperone DnaJ [Anaerolineaceae bacterium]
MAQRDYYEILGISRNASSEEIKNSFRQLARKYHPDVSKEPDAEDRFKELNEAYAILSDPDKRSKYDRFGAAGVNGMGGMPDFTSVDFSDIFEEFFGFGGGGSSRRRNAPRRGADLSYAVTIEFEEAVFGVDKEFEISRNETCSTCSGSGAKAGSQPVQCSECNGRGEVRQVRQTFLGSMVQVVTCPKCGGKGSIIESPCTTCRGSGQEVKTRKKLVHIPAGVDHGTQIRLAGEGQPGVNGGPHGNLYIEVRVKQHKFFRRRENDILLDLNINIAQATLGAEIQVPTLEKDHKLVIPPGTQPGKVFTLKGQGVPYLRGSGRGNQLVMIGVDIPTHVTEEQRALFEKLAATLGTEVLPQERGFFDRLKEVLSG